MELNYFKDVLFDAINDSDKMKVSDIETADKRNVFMVTTVDGSTIKVKCEMVSSNRKSLEA